MAIIEVGGVHGVGKSTTIESATARTNKIVPVLKGSEIMARILGVTTEDLPTMPPEKRRAAREQMFIELDQARNGVRDSHFCVYTDHGYEFPFYEKDKGIVAVNVLIEASVDKVLERRYQITRDRPKDINLIAEQIELEKIGAIESSFKLGVPLIIINNEEGHDASIKLATVFNEYLD